jgi:hypothetical protein
VALAYEFGGFIDLINSLVAAIQIKRINRIGKHVKNQSHGTLLTIHSLPSAWTSPIVAREWMVQMNLMIDMKKQQL